MDRYGAFPDRRLSARGEARRRAFLDAAADVFLEQGFAAASVTEVVARAGGSLATLYAQFGNKEGLFVAMIEDLAATAIDPMAGCDVLGLPLEDGLRELALRYMAVVAQPRGVRMFRTVVGEAAAHPELLARFLASGVDRARDTLREYLSDRIAAGEIAPQNVAAAADIVLDALRGRFRVRHLAGLGPLPDAAERARHVERVVSLLAPGLRAGAVGE